MLKDLINSGVSPVVVDTEEPERVDKFLPDLDFELYGTWDVSNGLVLRCGGAKYSSGPRDKSIDAALDYLRFANRKHFVLFLNPSKVEGIKGHCLVFAGPGLPNPKGSVLYELPPPAKEEYEEEFAKALKPKKSKALVQDCAKYAQGMLVSEAVNCFKYSVHTNTNFLENRHRFVSKNIVEYVNTDYTFKNLGGFTNFKEWFRKRAFLYKPEAQEYGIQFPRGVVLAGVPGGGKGLCVKALANESNLPLIRLDIAKVYDHYVGESERNLRSALTSIERLAPCIVFIDEFSRFVIGKDSQGDSGTTSRLFATLLTWLQEHDKPIFIAATVNDFQNLPQELIRKGRFAEVFGVGYPDYDDRIEIWMVHLNRRGVLNSLEGLECLARDSENMTGAEIEAVVEETLINCYLKGISKTNIPTIEFENTLKESRFDPGINHQVLNQIEKLRKV